MFSVGDVSPVGEAANLFYAAWIRLPWKRQRLLLMLGAALHIHGVLVAANVVTAVVLDPDPPDCTWRQGARFRH